jgi:MtN3 and saliva related transmembrane protein
MVGAIGAIAATLSVASFVPQAWKVIRTRKTDQLSAPMWVMSFTGFVLWTTYGVLQGAWALIVPNAICAVFAGFILIMKLLPPRSKHAVADALDPTHDQPRGS